MRQSANLFCPRAQKIVFLGLGLCLAAGTFAPAGMAQQDRQDRVNPALVERRTRAEQEAEQLVSLSSGTITDILLHEPGLLLQVKRVLVRKAYEQGRLLDPADLTDEALFQLIRDDANVRVLATREIEDRSYVRAKPSREDEDREQQRGWAVARTTAPAQGQPQPGEPRPTQSQEEKYWSQHEEVPLWQYGAYSQPEGEGSQGAGATSTERPGSQMPAKMPASPGIPLAPTGPDYQREQNMAGLEPQDKDSYDAVPPGADSMPRINPSGLPSLLSASVSDRSSSGQSVVPDRLPSFQGDSPLDRTPGLSSPPQLSSSGSDNRQSRYPQTASLDNRWRTPMPERRYPLAEDMHPVIRHRSNPYADVPLLYDLYTQVSKRSPVLERFGAEVFENGTGNFDELPMDLPVGPEYVLGPGDGLKIELWGGISQHLQRVVDREGRVALPESGAVQVSGRTLGDVQSMVQATLRSQFRDVQADVSLARLRSVRIYVVGDVVRPGAYDVSSLSTPLNALYLAGGPTSQGSLRKLSHYRGKELVQQVDGYDLLLHGVREGVQRLEAGDTILVPPMGPEVTVEGMVRRPAIYELNSESSLAEILELAGGVLNTGTLRHIDVERVQAHESRTMLRLDVPENNNQEAVAKAIEEFKIQDGDKIRISPILAVNEKTVYLDGHVFHPGKYAYADGMRVSDLIKSYNELLPEPSRRHAELIRLNPPDYSPIVIAFNLEDALAGKEQDLALKAYDTVRVFGRYDFEDPPVITVAGEVRDPGDHVTNGATHLRDAVYLAGGVTPDAQLDDAQIFRRTQDGKLQVLSVNLKKALAGDGADDVLLEPKDRVFVHRNLGKVDPATVKIEGEVARPGKYPLGENMSAAELVRLAGGLKRGAYTEAADLTRYTIASNSNVLGEHSSIPIGRALAGEPDTDVRLHDGDVLTIRQLSGWNDIGSVITVNGEVMHPGTYGIQEKERLSSILLRAGGLRADAYPYGAILVRTQVRELEEKTRADLIRKVQAEESSFKLSPDTGDPDDKLAKESALLQWRHTLDQLETTPPAGRLVVRISKDIRKWAHTPADIEVRAGDALFIPKTPNSVLVNGQVYNPTAISYRPGKSAGWYLGQAGGPTTMANKKAIIVVRADGSVAGHNGVWLIGDSLSTELRPGDMVFVPEKALGGGIGWRSLTLGAQLASSLAIAAEVALNF